VQPGVIVSANCIAFMPRVVTRTMICTTVQIYFAAPNVKCRFVSTMPGALIAVGAWIRQSDLLGIYFRYSSSYRSLGAALAFSIWLYWTEFLVLIAAQFNAELLQERRARSAPSNPRTASTASAGSATLGSRLRAIEIGPLASCLRAFNAASTSLML
jgi:uncharacterized BrkB/YihY/UPF0761 family membrane protein